MKFNVQKFNVAADAAEISQKIKQVALFESQRHSETDMSEMAKCIFSKPLQTGKGGASPQPPPSVRRKYASYDFFQFSKGDFLDEIPIQARFCSGAGCRNKFF